MSSSKLASPKQIVTTKDNGNSTKARAVGVSHNNHYRILVGTPPPYSLPPTQIASSLLCETLMDSCCATNCG